MIKNDDIGFCSAEINWIPQVATKYRIISMFKNFWNPTQSIERRLKFECNASQDVNMAVDGKQAIAFHDGWLCKSEKASNPLATFLLELHKVDINFHHHSQAKASSHRLGSLCRSSPSKSCSFICWIRIGMLLCSYMVQP